MTTNEAGLLIRVLHRDLVLAAILRWLLVTILAAGMVAATIASEGHGREIWLWTGTMSAAALWSVLALLSARQGRTANQATLFVANGRFDLAETYLREALKSFSMYAGAKLMACHNLAVVIHGRGEYAVAAELCGGILRRVRGVSGHARRTTRLLLADCQLSLHRPDDARTAMGDLDPLEPGLPLAERLMLLPIQVRCDVMAGRFETAVGRLKEKVRLAELLESPRAALVHALLGDACRSLSRQGEADWLTRRAALYHDLADLGDRYPTARTEELVVTPFAGLPMDAPPDQ